MAEVGVFTLENLTTGMYPSSLDALREYIQNSCDAIDKARPKILADDDGIITIDIDKDNRRITIEDNGTGIPVLDFKSTLTNIAYSDKTLETSRGFRGIGRLGGLAYCRELRFVSTAKGEGIKSTVIFNAAKLHELFYDNKKYTIKEALDEIVSFETIVADDTEHFFRVEMIDIVDTNEELLDIYKVRDYLSFVAPVTYSPNFHYQTEIYKHAATLNFKITEYKIEVNGEQLDKPYKMNVQTSMGMDEIFDVDFRDFYDGEQLIAWSWVGLSEFRGVLSKKRGTDSNKMRGLRLRAGNIQIGDAETLKQLFNETNGTNYFIGEIHIVDTNLRPNGRRDYLEENPAYKIFEAALKLYFDELNDIYRAAANVRTEQNKIDAPDKSEREFKEKSLAYQKSHEAAHEADMMTLNKAATTAIKKLSNLRQKAEAAFDTAQSKVVLRIIGNQPKPPEPPKPDKADGDKQIPPPESISTV